MQLILQPARRLLERVRVPRAIGAILDPVGYWNAWVLSQPCPCRPRRRQKNWRRARLPEPHMVHYRLEQKIEGYRQWMAESELALTKLRDRRDDLLRQLAEEEAKTR
jgi:hypothetical protein